MYYMSSSFLNSVIFYYISAMERIEKIIDLLAEKVTGIKGVYLYGSRAIGQERPDSDYDIAVLSEYPYLLKPMERFELSAEMGDRIQATVDLVDLRAVPLDFRFEIVAQGRRVYCSDTYYCDNYEMTVISMYQRFEQERKKLVEAYKERILSND